MDHYYIYNCRHRFTHLTSLEEKEEVIIMEDRVCGSMIEQYYLILNIIYEKDVVKMTSQALAAIMVISQQDYNI